LAGFFVAFEFGEKQTGRPVQVGLIGLAQNCAGNTTAPRAMQWLEGGD
jgi:hypothetical protein